MNFEYIKSRYKVPAEMYREVILSGKKGVITRDMGNYIGVHFYGEDSADPSVCHPTWEMTYLETFNYNPPIKKLTRGQLRYREWLRLDNGYSFAEWLGIEKKKK